FFGEVTLERQGILSLWTPTLATIDWGIVALTLVSGGLLLWLRWSIPAVLATVAGLSLIFRLLI
ncbi:MAG: chromate transporter, partial [Pseudomonadota bacterium]